MHDRIQEAILSKTPPAELRTLHQRVAEHLDRRDSGEATVSSTAYHYLRGETCIAPERVLDSCTEAGRLALAAHAPADALTFLEPAAELAERAGLPAPEELLRWLGKALYQCNRFAEAQKALTLLLATDRRPLPRARALGMLSRISLWADRISESIEFAAQGMAELGSPFPAGRLRLAVSAAGRLALGLLIRSTHLGFATATGEQRARYEILTELHEQIVHGAALSQRPWLWLVGSARAMPLAYRAGISPSYTRIHVGLGGALLKLGVPWWATRWLFAESARAAAVLDDPHHTATVGHMRNMVRFLAGIDNGEPVRQCLERDWRWLDVAHYWEARKVLCRYEILRGNTLAAQSLYDQGLARLGASAEAGLAVSINALLGRPKEVAAGLEALAAAPATNEVTVRLDLLLLRIQVAVEQGDLGESFERILADFAALGIAPRDLTEGFRPFFVYQAFGRLHQARSSSEAEMANRLEAARIAVRQLGLVARSSLLKAFHQVALASLEQLSGHPARAVRRLARVEPLLGQVDAPLVGYESARVWARAVLAQGSVNEATRLSRYALMIATDNGWRYRARWIDAEFGVGSMQTVRGWGAASSDSLETELVKRRLRALEEVSLAAFRVHDPRELARVALDETIRILAADRALLFLADGEELIPHLGRDRDGNDLTVFREFSTTVVDQVHTNRRVSIVTEGDGGVVSGTTSILTHGLRSIMVAPLELEGRLLGAVYLDSRVAKGIFTEDDATILVAIVNHIAMSLETSRAADLELAVAAANRDRDMAETLRDAMATISETLDPDTVLTRLLEQLIRVLPGEQGQLVLQREGDSGVESAALRERILDKTPLAGTAEADPPAEFRDLVSPAARWMVVPLRTKTTAVGFAVVTAASG
ncbi:MAG: GAF domain-containing protein, partial [Micromonosporaceae bacterium]|nr:GAF domain-containing protein [Micromonosporaceae bacterium]